MRQRVKEYLVDFSKALNNLVIGVESSTDDLDVDGTIKRFEICYELAWKLIKEYLADLGIICKSPRDCFKNAYINGIIDSEENWIKMIDDRNELVHTYASLESRKIFDRIKEYHVRSFKYLFERIKEKESNNE